MILRDSIFKEHSINEDIFKFFQLMTSVRISGN